MSTFSKAPVVIPQQTSSHDRILTPQYLQSPPSTNGTQPSHQVYINVDPHLDQDGGSVQTPAQAAPLPKHQTPPTNKKIETSSDGKARLRKACDSCSIRKVKCDEFGPPCKACVALEIPCTFNRQSKRRGPPNRHAEIVKKGRYDSPQGAGMLGLSQPSSPTHAAQTLASFAQQQVLSADTICPLPILHSLIDDYFTYIHSLIPLPHKPSFMEALARREDTNNTTFLALLASMIGCLVASFPRRSRHHFRAHNLDHAFPSSMSFVTRCRQVAMQAQGPGYLCGRLNIHDAIISYLWGTVGYYTYDRQALIINYNQCLIILNALGVRKANYINNRSTAAPQAKMIPNGHALDVSQSEPMDFVLQELSKRTFWVAFVGVRSLHQAGTLQFEITITPATESEPYPPLPLEIDDDYISPTGIFPQPPEIVSVLTGFNATARVFMTCNAVSTMELTHGVDRLYDWDNQKLILKDSLEAVNLACENLHTNLSLHLQGSRTQAPSHFFTAELEFYASNNGFDNRPIDYNRPDERRRIQYEAQKANICATQLGTRSYLIDKYLNLWDVRRNELQHQEASNDDPCSNDSNVIEQDIAKQREEIIKTFMLLLLSINRINMEPQGVTFINKIRHIASTLLNKPGRLKGASAVKLEDHLRTILDTLIQLERVDPQHHGVLGPGSEDDEEVQSRLWAEMSEHQQQFAQQGGEFQDLGIF